MKSRRRPRYWILAVLAVLHGLALSALLDVAQGEFGTRLWVAIATLWFLWLIVLTLYPGRTVWKIGALTIIVLFALGLFRIYDSRASFAFGLPEGFSLVPSETVSWTRAYLAGRAEAKKDVEQGRLIIEQYGFFAGSGHDVEILRDRYGIEVRATAQCIVDSQILGHAVGYNAISALEIERRSAHLVPDARPTMQINSSPPSDEIHVQIYHKLDSVPDVRSHAEHISIGMQFKVEPPG